MRFSIAPVDGGVPSVLLVCGKDYICDPVLNMDCIGCALYRY